jgi:hypothetical protein
LDIRQHEPVLDVDLAPEIPPTYLVLVGAHAEVLDSFAGVLGATEQESVASSGSTESQLVQGDGLTTGSNDAGTGGGGEPKGGNGNLGDLEQTVIIRDGTDNDDSLALLASGDLALDTRDGNRRSVHAGHEQTAEDDLVEGGVGTAYDIKKQV